MERKNLEKFKYQKMTAKIKITFPQKLGAV
jgi:hypothetical protein